MHAERWKGPGKVIGCGYSGHVEGHTKMARPVGPILPMGNLSCAPVPEWRVLLEAEGSPGNQGQAQWLNYKARG